MEKWQEDAGVGQTHELHEVTVQLDGLGQLRRMQAESASAQEGSDGPVFVDESGRRSKKFRRLGWVLATACACYAITLVAALAGGNSTAPWLPGLGQAGEKQTDQVEIQPAPTDRASTVATPGSTPDAPTPSDSTGAVLPQPSGSTDGSSPPAVPAPGGSGSPPAKPSGGPAAPRPAVTPSVPSTAPGPPSSAPGPTPSDSGPPGDPTDPPVQEGAP
ncbi:hypothetical protein [Streptomyces sp. NPDC002889]|uniref:hypothetical protein n=1 Tax=Streptomyces sp. NPDC002889 TaxID=3364669 RepID=UPI0036AE9AEE